MSAAYPGHRARRDQAGAAQRGIGRSGVLGFMRLMWALDHAMVTRSKWMERTLGVTGPQRLVVRLLGRAPGVSPGVLAETLSFHPSTLTGVLSRLLAGGLLTRETDPEDRRRSLLRLTKKGRVVDGHVEGTVEEAVRRAIRRSSKQDLEATERVLGALVEELERVPARRAGP
jgi:DNA-binding MarR family transcriptional regulator